MGFLRGMLAPAKKRDFSLTDYEAWAAAGLTGPSSAAGVSVTVEGSLRLAAVWACVRVLSQTMATLPLMVYERLERGKRRATDHPLFSLLHSEPNPLMTSAEWRQALMGHLALWGNAYCEIETNGAGRPIALWPLRPDRMAEVRRTGDGLVYLYELPDGKKVTLAGERVFHVRGLSMDGVIGYSPIATTRQAVALGIAAEEFGARFFGNDARPGGVLQHPGVLGDEAHSRLQGSWESRHGGLARSHRVAILEEGMTYQQIGIPPEDAQFLETRKFQAEEIARMFGVPAHKIGLLDRATFSNIEHQSIEFVTDTVRPWAVQWEQAILARLLSRAERERYFAEFLVDGLLRGDTATRFSAYAMARQNGWMSANDIRELENMNPVDGGDVYLVPLNMVPAESVGRPTTDDGRPPEEEQGSGGEGERGGRSTNYELRITNGRGEIRAGQWDAAQARRRLQIAYLSIYEDVAARIMKREANDILNAARRFLKRERPHEFLGWLFEFWEEHIGYVGRQYRPVVESYAAQIADLVAREMVADESPDSESFVEAYVEGAAIRHVARQRAKLRDLINEHTGTTPADIAAEEDGESEGSGPALLAAIEGMMEKWREEGPGVMAREESVRANNALALTFYRILGAERKVWVTFGENCPYCDSLAGRSIPIDGYFLLQGQDFKPDGAGDALRVGNNVGHAPAHGGCDCMIVAD